MPFPVHPRLGGGGGTVAPTRRERDEPSGKGGEHPSAGRSCCSGRYVVLFALSSALALALLLMLALQFVSLQQHGEGESAWGDMFSQVRVKLPSGGEQFSVFGRKLLVGDGDYFLDIPYAPSTPRVQPTQVSPLLKNFYAIHYGFGCPNGFVRTKPSPAINWNPPPLEVVPLPENCHTLNIYRCSNSENSQQLLPVLVYVPEGHWLKRSNANLEPTSTIHGLACGAGDGDGMIVVSINYRIGPYGLFSAPHWPQRQRNLALGDIHTALEWVQQHIVHFGGHRAHVTVMARGEGARLISLLNLLPDTQSLFKRQILLSGSAFLPVLLQPEPPLSNSNNDTLFDPAMHFAIAANCVNEREWGIVAKSRDKPASELEEAERHVRNKLDRCVQYMGHEAIVAADAHIRTPSFVRWPLRAGPSSSMPPVPTNPFAAGIPSTPTMLVVCTFGPAENDSEHRHRETQPSPEGSAFRRRMEDALREELTDRMRQMGDLSRLEYAGAIIQHYLEAASGLMEPPEELFQKITEDFSLIGPILLEAFVRARIGSARVYALRFRASASLNLSSVDSAETAAASTNAWAASQGACLDDLLFNPKPPRQDARGQREVRQFAKMVANFVTYGNPNSEEQTDEWPLVYKLDRNGGRASFEDQPQWLDLNEGRVLNGWGLLMGNASRESAHFWLCDLPKRMNIPVGDLCPEGTF